MEERGAKVGVNEGCNGWEINADRQGKKRVVKRSED